MSYRQKLGDLEMSQSLLADAFSNLAKVTIEIAPSRAAGCGLAFKDRHRHIDFRKGDFLAVVLCASDCSSAYPDFSMHRSVSAAINKLRYFYKVRKFAYIIDKLGNLYRIRGERLIFVQNVGFLK